LGEKVTNWKKLTEIIKSTVKLEAFKSLSGIKRIKGKLKSPLKERPLI